VYLALFCFEDTVTETLEGNGGKLVQRKLNIYSEKLKKLVNRVYRKQGNTNKQAYEDNYF